MKTLCSYAACIGMALISCKADKEPPLKLEKLAVANQPASTLSTVVAYWKDNVTPITSINNYPGYNKQIMYTIGPITVEAGDVLSAHFQQQLNINSPVNVMAACLVVIGTNNAVKDQTSAGFVGFIAKASGSNISVPEEGSCEVLARNGSFQFTAPSNSIYINAVVYGGSTSSQAPNYTVPGGGELVAVLERGVTWYKASGMLLPKAPYRGGALKFSVPIDAPNKHVEFSVGPLSIPAGTMVDVRHHIEATAEVPNDGSHQRLGRSLIQGSSATATGGTTLLPASQSGITWGEHHSTMSPAAGNYYAAATSNVFFNSVLYAYGWTGQPLFIEGFGPNLYGDMFVELRESAPGNFFQQSTSAISELTATPQVLYSVGPMDIDPGQIVEVRYSAAFHPNAGQSTVLSRIIRTTSPTSTTGTVVQPFLARRFHNNYVYTNMVQTTADRNNGATTLTGQYYNVVAYRTTGPATCPVMTTWGEMEAVKR
ncbi:hypothetical protein [Chitinophaga niabensis]|uniref:Uncharacterized protein n=1 Tax=Chitinophaga niabensis TaxID=536979 RepID=A0A1N6GZX2_9BACT|nr:hypothetical protein [Chitinophaga niabensis]SIO13094.1 hypothetical protein SAMN04488055_3091 [Chitinophaga niabensis]